MPNTTNQSNKQIARKLLSQLFAVFLLIFMVNQCQDSEIDHFNYSQLEPLVISDEIVSTVVNRLAGDLAVDNFYSYSKNYGLTYTVGLYARQTLFEEKMGKDYHKITGNTNFDFPLESELYELFQREMAFQELRTYLMDTARMFFSRPQLIKSIYLLKKEKIVNMIKKTDCSRALKDELAIMIPFFDYTLPQSTQTACQSRLDCWLEWNDDQKNNDKLFKVIDLERKIYKKHHLYEKHFNYYEWARRREAEGGKELVRAWGWMAHDLFSSI